MMEIYYSFLLLNEALPAAEPTNPEQQRIFRSLMANSFRLTMWLLLDDIRRTGAAVHPESQMHQVRTMEGQLERIGQPEKDLSSRVLAALATAHREGPG
jgi:hypothetical protein